MKLKEVKKEVERLFDIELKPTMGPDEVLCNIRRIGELRCCITLFKSGKHIQLSYDVTTDKLSASYACNIHIERLDQVELFLLKTNYLNRLAERFLLRSY